MDVTGKNNWHPGDKEIKHKAMPAQEWDCKARHQGHTNLSQAISGLVL